MLKEKMKEMLKFNNESNGFSIPTAQEIYDHVKVIKVFRYFINIFGTNFFQVQIFSWNEINNLPTCFNAGNNSENITGFYEDFAGRPIQMLNFFLASIADKKNTTDIFKRFFFLSLKKFGINSTQSNFEKDEILKIIIKRMS